jgi:hypothetical protein
MFVHCLYNNYSSIATEILDFFKEFLKKVELGGVHPTGHRH